MYNDIYKVCMININVLICNIIHVYDPKLCFCFCPISKLKEFFNYEQNAGQRQRF